MFNRLATCVTCLFLYPCIADDAVAQSNTTIKVDNNIQVSASNANIHHTEVILCAHPDDANTMLAVSHFFPEGRVRSVDKGVAYVTHDGGRSWQHAVDTIDIGKTSFDPDCVFGRNGSIYYISSWFDPGKPFRAGESLLVLRSLDAGRSWEAPVKYPGAEGLDRPWVAVDNTGGPNDGRVYVTGTMVGRTLLSGKASYSTALFTSSDGGKSFASTPERFHDYNQAGPTNIIIMSDGTIAWLQSGGVVKTDGTLERTLYFVSSADGRIINDGIRLPEYFAERTGIASLAVDNHASSPFAGRLYAVWTTVNPDPTARLLVAPNRDGVFPVDIVREGRDVVITYSDDDGKSWAPVSAVARGGAVGVNPKVVVNKDGVVGVSWYDDGKDKEFRLSPRVSFAASHDGGETFSPRVAVSKYGRGSGRWRPGKGVLDTGKRWRPADERSAGYVELRITTQTLGHTAGLVASADGSFQPLWIDFRTGIGQVWTARVDVAGKAARFGSPALAKLEDLSVDADIRFEDVVYDFEKGIITAEALLTNDGQSMMRDVSARALATQSSYGLIHVLNADNGKRGPGAVWDFASVLPKGGLPPGETSAPKIMKFKLEDEDFNDAITYELLLLDLQILGARE